MSPVATPPRPAARFRRTLAAAAILLTLSTAGACRDSTAPNPVAGTYTATVLKVVPEGETEVVDLKAYGGSLTVTIAENYATSGELFVPASLVGEDFHFPMTGTAVVNGNTLTFTQASDTFIRDLAWTVSGNTISVTNQLLDGDRWTITLAR